MAAFCADEDREDPRVSVTSKNDAVFCLLWSFVVSIYLI